jgi:hypothetical protein
VISRTMALTVACTVKRAVVHTNVLDYLVVYDLITAACGRRTVSSV